MHSLAVNAVLESTRISEIEGGAGEEDISVRKGRIDGGGGAGVVARGSSLLGSSSECAAAFKVLKIMVKNWLSDVQNHGNMFADDMLINFYRWLCSPKVHCTILRFTSTCTN